MFETSQDFKMLPKFPNREQFEPGPRTSKKYALGSSVNYKVVFDFPYILCEDTVSYIQDSGKIMFIVRGPPNTGKSALSEIVCKKYPSAVFCSADLYFRNTFASCERTKENVQASHEYCANQAKTACINKEHLIIVRNTHMKKWEMQPYLNLAAKYNYTIIMAITLYRFDVTPEALAKNSTDGLNVDYFRKRLRQWEDVPPFLTGWFLCPNDTFYLQTAAFKALENLTWDGRFCRVFNAYDIDEIAEYFKVRNILCCLAGYSADNHKMKNYYFTPAVQDAYGKCFSIIILGYHVTSSNLNAVVYVGKEMEPLIFHGTNKQHRHLVDHLESPEVYNNIFEFGKTGKFLHTQTPSHFKVSEEDWDKGDEIDAFKSTCIHLAQRDGDIFDISKIRAEFQKSLCSVADIDGKIDDSSYIELENNTKVCRIEKNQWLIKANKKIIIRSIFSGFYP